MASFQDQWIKFMTHDGKFRGTLAVVSGVLQELIVRHDLWPTTAAALGRSLAGGALLVGLLKDDQRLALKFEGNGPIRKILVEASHHDGTLRATVGNPHVDLRTPDGQFDVAKALGRTGWLTVTKDLGLRSPYVGTVALVSGEIGEDLAFYLADSEQIPSAVSVGTTLFPDGTALAGGFLLQAMPPVDERLVEQTMERLGKLPGATALLAQATTLENIVHALLGNHAFELLEQRNLHFACSCSREKIEQILLSLGKSELEKMANTGENIRVRCEFCLQEYVFASEDVRRIALAVNTPGAQA